MFGRSGSRWSGVVFRVAGTLAVLALTITVGACTSDADTTKATTTTSSPAATTDPSSTTAVSDLTPTILDILAGGTQPFGDMMPGSYSLDPDLDPSTPVQVTFEVPASGWKTWIGAAKFSDAGHVGVSITTVSNLVGNGCRDHLGADPPVGPSVDDLATALADLAPFRVTSPPEDVSIYGYSGQHLELTVPNLAVSDNVFTGCEDGKLMSWIGAIDTTPGDAYYGYTGPAYTEEFWLLDVDGDRLMIAAEQSPGSPPKDIEELRDILHSIQIET